jgi:multidrug resistance protein, MATE family
MFSSFILNYFMNKKILRLAIPNIISNISVPLLSMVDLAIAGHMGSVAFIGAVGVAGVIFNFIYWNFGFLRMGTTGFTAQAYGARDIQETVSILIRSSLIALFIAFVLIVFQNSILKFSFYFIDASLETRQPIIDYFKIRIWAAPCALLLYAFKGWFIGMQNSKFPMFIAIVINILNIVFSLLFVYTLKMGFKGIAIGTVLAQYSGVILTLILWFFYYGKLKKHIDFTKVFVKNRWLIFFKVNGNIFLRTFCLVIVFTSFTTFSTKSGDTILAVNTLLMQLFTLFSYIMDGFAYAGESLTGKYIGANNRKDLQLLIRYIFRWGWILTLIFTIMYYFRGDLILQLLTNNKEIIAASRQYFFWVLFIPITGFAAFLWDGIYVGATASKAMRNAIFLATLVYFVFYYLTVGILGNDALWVALLLFLLLRGFGMWVLSKRVISRSLKKDIND